MHVRPLYFAAGAPEAAYKFLCPFDLDLNASFGSQFFAFCRDGFTISHYNYLLHFFTE